MRNKSVSVRAVVQKKKGLLIISFISELQMDSFYTIKKSTLVTRKAKRKHQNTFGEKKNEISDQISKSKHKRKDEEYY